jgi:hypothetical protein
MKRTNTKKKKKAKREEQQKILWDSNKVWGNRNARTVTNTDRDDPQIHHLHGPGRMEIDGNGNANFFTDGAQGSVRIYISAPNKNSEMTGKIKTDKSLVNWDINLRANHVDKCSWGGYHFIFSLEDQQAYVKKEIVHADYGSESDIKDFPKKVKADGKKYGFRCRVSNTSDKKVRLQSWIDFAGRLTNWTPLVDFIDNGDKWPGLEWADSDAKKCFNGRKGLMATRDKSNYRDPMFEQQPHVWIRLNAAKEAGDFIENVVVSNVVLKEIVP